MQEQYLRERVMKYLNNLEHALHSLKIKELADEKVKYTILRVIENVKAYLQDAKHYLTTGDYITSLVCVVYGEGLLDSLRELGYIKYEWKMKEAIKLPKVLVAGTFDLLHPGHLFILKEAWKLGKVIVVVARDSNVPKFKGRPPIIPERQRVEVLKNIKWVDKVILGDEKDIFKSIERIKPDIILLGPDQPIDEGKLKHELKLRNLKARIIRIRKRSSKYPLSSTSAIVKKILEIFNAAHPHF